MNNNNNNNIKQGNEPDTLSAQEYSAQKYSAQDFEAAASRLLDFIQASPTCFHTVKNISGRLDDAGYEKLCYEKEWHLVPGKSYYTIRADSSLIAFRLPEGTAHSFHMTASHCDSPSFKLKENCEILRDGKYTELNVEKYGGMLCAPWFDRPLSIAGRLTVRDGEGRLRSELISFDRDLVMLPSLAIHLNREANKGTAFRIQSDMLPLMGSEEIHGRFKDMLAKEARTKAENILGYDLFLYDRSRPCIWGADREYISSPRLDDLMCVFSSIEALLSAEKSDSISMCCIFDSEEIGSCTMNGADSEYLKTVMDRILSCLCISHEQSLCMLSRSFMLSADNGHAVHPNHIDKNDPTNHVYMNHGILIKHSAAGKYTTNAVSASVFRELCLRNSIPFQEYVNNSDIPGGSTLGSISGSHVSVYSADIGAAQLAMHSPYETAGVKDTRYLIDAMTAFFGCSLNIDEDGSITLRQ